MTKLSVIEKLISSVRKYLERLEKMKRYSLADYEENEERIAALERNLYLVVQSSLDLAEAVIAYKDLRRPATFAESFEILKENDLIDVDLNSRLVQMAKFRNLIAHDYEDVQFNQIYDVLQNSLSDIEQFLTSVKNSLKI